MSSDLLDSLPDSLPVTNPAEVGMSAERLERIGPVIERYIDRQLIPGALSLVARHGKIVHFQARGYRNAEQKLPVEGDTIFRIASMTKPITSVALMMLYERGELQLHDPISKWLPAFEKMQVSVERDDGSSELVAAKRAINVRHILTHTAGFTSEYNQRNREALQEAARFRGPDEVIGDFVDRLATVPLNHEPGQVWDYSRATCVVGRLIEVISGQTLAEFFREHIFEPLGMIDTHFFLPEEKLDRFCVAYSPGDGQRITPSDPDTTQSFWLSQPGIYFIGSGGLVSTAADYFRFADMLRQGGRRDGVRILSRKTVELMTRNHIGDRWVWLSGPGQGFGLGFGVTKDRGQSHMMPSEGSYTWGGAFNTHWWNDPVEQLFGLVMTQVRPYTHLNLRADFQTLVTAAIDD